MSQTSLENLRVAIVHDWLSEYAGSERVVEQMLAVLPRAELYSLVDFLPDDQRGFLGGRTVRTSSIQRWPLARRGFRKYLALMPYAIEQFDLSAYDLVLSSSHAVAKGVLTGPDQLHVCFCHSPIRYAWDLTHEYLRGGGLDRGLRGMLARWVLHYLRIWDVRTTWGVDRFLAVSAFIARRIGKTYGREAEILHPPVDVDAFTPRREKEDFYLAASRLAPYKRMPMIAETFRRLLPDRRLVIIGDGPDARRVRAAAGGNVTWLGRASHEVLVDHMQRARALVFAAREDFGIVPVEAQACATPVIAFGRGGARETVRDGRTGVLFDEQSAESLAAAVRAFEQREGSFDPAAIRTHAERFSIPRFRRQLADALKRYWADHQAARA